MRATDGFRNKLMIPDSEIPKYQEFEVKSKIGKTLKNIISLKNILLRFIKMILIFINIVTKKIQTDKNECNYILFRIDIYFSEFFQQYKLMKKDITIETLFSKKKDKKHQQKNLVVNLLELIQVMQKVVMIQIILW